MDYQYARMGVSIEEEGKGPCLPSEPKEQQGTRDVAVGCRQPVSDAEVGAGKRMHGQDLDGDPLDRYATQGWISIGLL